MTWEIVVGLIALVGFGISVMTPIIKLNTSITKLNCTIDALNENVNESKARIGKHGEEIDNLDIRVTKIEEHMKMEAEV